MNNETIEARLESKLAGFEQSLLVRFREVVASAAARGALRSSARILQMVAALGDEIDAFAASGLSDLPAIERAGADSAFFYETLGTKLIQLRLRGDAHIAKAADWAGPSAVSAANAQSQARLAAALLKVKQHQQGFDRDHTSVATTHYSISDSPGAVLQAGSPGATATVSVHINHIAEALAKVEAAAAGLDLDGDAAADLRGEIATIRAQLDKKSPTPIILRESANTLRSIGENLAAGAMQPAFMIAVQALIAAVS
jgi:hypothetical protein